MLPKLRPFSCLFVLLAFGSAPLALAQDGPNPLDAPERINIEDVQEPHCRELLTRSVFAQGYLSGYEAGFEMADEDVHMGRTWRQLKKTKEFKKADEGFSGKRRNRDDFRSGYREGLQVGYSDAISGGEFRAITQLTEASKGLDKGAGTAPAEASLRFNSSFQNGFETGRQIALAHRDTREVGNEADQVCTPQFGFRATGDTGACEGFRRGFLLGFASFVGDFMQSANPLRRGKR